MSGFKTKQGRIALVPDDNIDTDRIIPARFLSRVERTGYGELLFNDVRGEGFPLDQESAKGATILVAGTNFGCGSSREHAVWAIQQAGFHSVFARQDPASGTSGGSPGFSDIFRQNAANCGLLVADISAETFEALVKAGQGADAAVDLPNQLIHVGDDAYTFQINPATKEALIAGLDLIGSTLLYEEQISAFEKSQPSYVAISQ